MTFSSMFEVQKDSYQEGER